MYIFIMFFRCKQKTLRFNTLFYVVKSANSRMFSFYTSMRFERHQAKNGNKSKLFVFDLRFSKLKNFPTFYSIKNGFGNFPENSNNICDARNNHKTVFQFQKFIQRIWFKIQYLFQEKLDMKTLLKIFLYYLWYFLIYFCGLKIKRKNSKMLSKIISVSNKEIFNLFR